MTDHTTQKHCLNCGTAFVLDNGEQMAEVYCYACGQGRKDGRLSILKLIKDGITSVFNLDGRLAHTIKDIFKTAKMTRTYIEGKRKFYVNPARLFIFSLILLVSLIVFLLKLDNKTLGVDDIYTQSESTYIYEDFVNYTDSVGLRNGNPIVDSIEANVFNGVNTMATDTFGIGTINLFSYDIDVDSYGISTYDIVHLSVPEILEKYKVEKREDQIAIGQMIRGLTDPASLITHVVKNITWAVLGALIILCFFMYLLYIRGRYYLIEHAVLILNGHSAIFICSAVAMISYHLLIKYEIIAPSAIATITTGLLFLGAALQFVAMKQYYQQGYFKTFVKWSILCFSYMIIFSIVLVLVALISVLLY